MPGVHPGLPAGSQRHPGRHPGRRTAWYRHRVGGPYRSGGPAGRHEEPLLNLSAWAEG